MLNNTNVIIEALNYTRAGVLITDPSLEDNPIVYANQGFVDMTGYTKEDIIGKNCRFLQGEETNRSEVSRLREGIKKIKHRFLLNSSITKKDGTKFWNSLSVDSLYMEDEDKHYFVGVQRDVTERKEIELNYEKSLEEVKSLAFPIVPLLDGIAVLPLIGEMSEERFQAIFRDASAYVGETKVETFILDVSGLTKLRNYEMEGILKLKSVLSLLGTEMQLSGVSTDMAIQAVNLTDIKNHNIKTATSVKHILERLLKH
ncbi:STAS domain-containing protein [Geomicrobium sp. JCM 19055]|uniref:STAS domain-containing protein n=1 Tax=Geomicrobium sp. JCM 19055 TaxID=1460649 RepID=UPI00045ED0B7|nr:PAS domain-containing protein [Geomicrobium sp. JCM 19055]GAJ98508.1 sensory box histidine kinase [Geomicrobium sp. JCM 19055]